MINIKLTVQYVGTNYKGFQRQKMKKTIQDQIENALFKIFEIEIGITGCGRTDSGVHALMHVSNFKLEKDLKIPIFTLRHAINAHLPEDILCTDCAIVHEDFHSRYSAKEREYMYVIYNSEKMPPFYLKRAWNVYQKLNTRKLKKTLKFIKGEHDFTNFCANLKENENRIRKITGVKVKQKGEKVFIYIKGYAFLHKMIRMIVGTAVDISLKNEKPSKMKEFLNPDFLKKGYRIAPPYGLYLYRIKY